MYELTRHVDLCYIRNHQERGHRKNRARISLGQNSTNLQPMRIDSPYSVKLGTSDW